jgi:nitrogen-specific signal transduction histidine kinase
VRNIWLHDQLTVNHKMMADVLRELSSACIVVGRNLNMLNYNKAARKLLLPSLSRGEEPEFSHLPPLLGSKIYQVLQTGNAIAPFKFEPDKPAGAAYQVSIVPFLQSDEALPEAALLMVEDQTQSKLLQKLEVEAENLRLIKTMADRLAHEIGNAMVPLATHQQLLVEKFRDAEFRTSLDQAMADGVKRVSRFVNQMRFLARDGLHKRDAFPLTQMLEEAFQDANIHQPVKSARLKYQQEGDPIIISGERSALKHAFSEIMLNALQANVGNASIGVTMETESSTNGHACVRVEVKDNGPGFREETTRHWPRPFESGRTVGLGLGLCVTRKIVEMHHGKLEIVPSSESPSGIVRITLPVDLAAVDQL